MDYIMWVILGCAGCLKKRCNHWDCMKSITPEMVFEEYKKKVK